MRVGSNFRKPRQAPGDTPGEFQNIYLEIGPIHYRFSKRPTKFAAPDWVYNLGISYTKFIE